MSDLVEGTKRTLKSAWLSVQTQAEARQRRQSESEMPLVVFLGDSRAKSWPTPASDTKMNFCNRGIGFDTSTHVLNRVALHVLPLHPQVVVLQVGINDFRELLLQPESASTIISRCRQNIGQIVKKLRTAGTHLVLSTVFPVADVTDQPEHSYWGIRTPRAADQVNQAVMVVNTSLRMLKAPDVALLDAHALLSDEKGFLQSHYAKDALHLNEEGYAALNGELPQLLQECCAVVA